VLNNIHYNFDYRNAPTKYSKIHCANSDLLVLYIHEEKSPPDFSPNPMLELLFAKNARALPHLPIEHHTTKTKSFRIRPTMATFTLAQHNNQPTIPQH
jgi:hypothetical protein